MSDDINDISFSDASDLMHPNDDIIKLQQTIEILTNENSVLKKVIESVSNCNDELIKHINDINIKFIIKNKQSLKI